MADVFLSYKTEDRPLAEGVTTALEQAGYSVWWDQRLTPRTSWDELIERELNAAKAVLVLWTPKAVASEWVRTEATAAKDANKLVHARLETCVLPLAFRMRQVADLTLWDGNASNPNWIKTLHWLRELVGEPEHESRLQAEKQVHDKELLALRGEVARLSEELRLAQTNASRQDDDAREQLHALKQELAALRDQRTARETPAPPPRISPPAPMGVSSKQPISRDAIDRLAEQLTQDVLKVSHSEPPVAPKAVAPVVPEVSGGLANNALAQKILQRKMAAAYRWRFPADVVVWLVTLSAAVLLAGPWLPNALTNAATMRWLAEFAAWLPIPVTQWFALSPIEFAGAMFLGGSVYMFFSIVLSEEELSAGNVGAQVFLVLSSVVFFGMLFWILPNGISLWLALLGGLFLLGICLVGASSQLEFMRRRYLVRAAGTAFTLLFIQYLLPQ